MKKHMSYVFTFIFAFAFVSFFMAVFAFADGKGKMYNIYNGTSVIVDNSWEFVESEKTLYIRSNSHTAYNETGSISHDEANSWKPYISRIEHIVLEGYFVKCSTYAFRNHTALRDVRITENVKEIDGGAFEGCVNLESIAIGDSEFVHGRADLSNVRIMRSKNALNNTKINEIILSDEVRIEGSDHFNAGVRVCIPKGSAGYDYFVSTGLYNVIDSSPVTLKIIIDGESYSKSLDFGEDISLDIGAVPNYVYTKEELLSVLSRVSLDESHYIQGQHLNSNIKELSGYLDDARKEAGALPAMVSFDISQLPLDAKTMSIIEECKEFIRRGGIVSFSYHMENPMGNYTGNYPCRGELGSESKWEELIRDGTELNTKFNVILDKAYKVLNEFDREGYSVIWRPIHENNGNWFWWCAIQTFDENGTEVTRPIDQETVISLWRYVYNYFEVEKGLKNLVWAYSPNVTNADSPLPTVYCYPGDEYCDIAGTDWYTAGAYEIDGKGRSYMSLAESTGKMAALTEFGPGGALIAQSGQVQSELFTCRDQLDIIKRMIGDGMSPTYVLNWSGNCALLKLGEMKSLMNDKVVLDLDEVKDMFDAEYKKRQ